MSKQIFQLSKPIFHNIKVPPDSLDF